MQAREGPFLSRDPPSLAGGFFPCHLSLYAGPSVTGGVAADVVVTAAVFAAAAAAIGRTAIGEGIQRPLWPLKLSPYTSMPLLSSRACRRSIGPSRGTTT